MKKLLPSIIFNLAESLVIILIGFWLNLGTKEILMILLLFAMTRMRLGGAMHYKDWYRCLIWSALVFLSLFIVAKSGIVLSIIMTIFCAYILTGKGNIDKDYIPTRTNIITDMFLWKNNKCSKYSDIEEYIKYHPFDEELINLEEKIKKRDNIDYLIYKYRFKDKLTFTEISDKLEIDNPRIVERLDNIAFAIRLYCGI